MSRRRAMTVLLAVSVAATTLSAQDYRIGSIDLFGPRRVSPDDVRRALTFKEGDPIALKGGDVPSYLEESERRIAMLPGVRQVRTNIVCCDDNLNIVVFVGIEEEGQPPPAFRPGPAGGVRLPSDVVLAGEELEAAFEGAIQRGNFREDDSQGHALFEDPATRAVQQRFVGLAERHLTVLREVLRESSNDRERALAAEVLGYARDKQGVVNDLVAAMSDPAEEVRNNAMRALLVFTRMTAGPAPRVPYEPFIRMLNSPIWTDRNKASGALDGLSATRSPELLTALREQALDSLAEMARWKSRGHAMAAFTILGRMAGFTDPEILELWTRDDREPVIVTAVRGR